MIQQGRLFIGRHYETNGVEELELLNQSLRNRDKLTDDAISQLSDQLVALSTRLQEIERRQQLAKHIFSLL